mmetsp:Transcript_140681/g.248518  ORF Transcript_140681/g.248518 Transcript_140681/m.248518 type:complete len:204 (-) Transcript_140681:251-862(-)
MMLGRMGGLAAIMRNARVRKAASAAIMSNASVAVSLIMIPSKTKDAASPVAVPRLAVSSLQLGKENTVRQPLQIQLGVVQVSQFVPGCQVQVPHELASVYHRIGLLGTELCHCLLKLPGIQHEQPRFSMSAHGSTVRPHGPQCGLADPLPFLDVEGRDVILQVEQLPISDKEHPRLFGHLSHAEDDISLVEIQARDARMADLS